MSATTAPPTPTYLPQRQLITVIGALMLGMLLAALDQTIVSTALPRIVSDFGGVDKLSWVATAYLLTSTAATPLYGKVSDMFGRKLVFQFAIVTFLLGSALAGASQNMGELIATRALQGIGAGGLMALVFAIIGDIVPPRERPKYMAPFVGVWGLASVAGPLLGGFFTQHLSWRWIFYVNLPVGAVTLVVVAAVLKLPVHKQQHKVDYTGAALLVAAVTSLLLYLSWAGTEYGWVDGRSLALAALGVVLGVVFVLQERRAAEPIVPLDLFRNDVVSVTSVIGFVLGTVMFGSTIYIPLYLQIVKGYSPTESGLRMLPLMLGIAIASITSGRLISRFNRYKVFPIIGTITFTIGLFLMSRLAADTSALYSGIAMFVVGAGVGLVMQVLMVAVQNAVDFSVLGVATSMSTFFRSMGGTFGIAVLGAVLTSRLGNELADRVPASAAARLGDPKQLENPAAIVKLPEPVHGEVVESFVHALQSVFLWSIPVAVVAFVFSLLLREVPLRGRTPSPEQRAEGEAAEVAPVFALD
ncbi:EmrB/QacA subfamily drug resistance transporter [Motilibacter rhizosphaerae]|uniref:EmrB/QacA subfamily drug resistance transporter n=1 Tax=Motilibacter rhizosphaerae TaxID=598652 RepID=A0A4Q7NQE8_9ACTN|nr:MDR family MFS transporter [Motilibacter rhizosphaerae]RZS87318.1 EmrB/QacA subfamily drug resistance transporter [Motilibacter rhizosphaerae]